MTKTQILTIKLTPCGFMSYVITLYNLEINIHNVWNLCTLIVILNSLRSTIYIYLN